MAKVGKKKMWVIITSVICAAVLVVAAVCAWIFIPRHGKMSDETWVSGDPFDVTKYQTVEKKPGEEFKILQLADIQLGVPTAKKDTEARVREAIESSNPDLILLTGDNVEGPLGGWLLPWLCDLIDSYGIPWAPVYGNHERQSVHDLNWQGDVYESYENCLFEKGPTTLFGVGNYAFNLTENGKIVYSFIMMDSGGWREYTEELGGYDYIKEDQIAWYDWYVRGVSEAVYGEFNPQAGKVVPSICAFHIPLPEYAEAMKDYVDENGVGAPPQTGHNVGENNENVCCPPINSGLFDRAKELGSTRAFIAGHDHVNNSVIEYEGIDLAYGYKVTRNNYHDDAFLGYTVITMSPDCSELTYEQIPSQIVVEK